ncbi:hypothetical protein P5G51_016605 [Virgibacillus sp. 179-BFC.A HS]|uniref:Uncharacterized protein n=1 Tax=Tigheibacillus jepli TaxID=3035914 RepID=A0ABU5CK85_9BACI|nr:hypothetical protein [Virgibacillus sp. 179-BFC.A HS]MDY0406761.1 hypothetical protein [Virgibacillus sp. 179-BFC.A HS]
MQVEKIYHIFGYYCMCCYLGIIRLRQFFQGRGGRGTDTIGKGRAHYGGDHSSVTDNDSDDKDINGEDNAVSGEDNESQEGSSNPGNSDGQKNTENAAPAESENAQIANMDDAIAFLKKELDERDEINIADTEFIPNDDSPKTDDKGTYYVVSLDSISMKESGGSGTIGKYKVYENGEYELAY